MRGFVYLASLLFVAVLSGCGGSSDSATANGESFAPDLAAVPDLAPDLGQDKDDESEMPTPSIGSCETKLPQEVREFVVESPLPNSFDRDRTPDELDSDVTLFKVAVMLPERCESDRFPVVIESHGYSGSRDDTIDEDGEVNPDTPHFPAIDELYATLPHHDYVAVSFDQRGHGDSLPENGGGYARIIAPRAETQDARALLDWLYDRAAELHIQTQEDTRIDRDIKVGLLGYSYGGGYQLGLSQLDERIDTIVPNGTWHSLLYSLLPGNGVKRSFIGILCLLAETGSTANTPAVTRMCELVGPASAQANVIRTWADLIEMLEADGYTEAEVVELFDRHTRYLQRSAEQGQPWCEPGQLGCSSTGDAFSPRSVPTLLIQGNRDVLFNLTEAYWNWKYFRNAASEGVPVSILSTEGGHMNPLANQTEGSANCGGLVGTDIILSWFDFHLKGEESELYNSIPSVCISVADTANAETAEPAGLVLNDFPVGSQSGAGAIPVRLETIALIRTAAEILPTFVALHDVTGESEVLAGIPRLDRVQVIDGDAGLPGDITAIAHIGIGIERGGEVFLVDDQVTSLTVGDYVVNPAIGEPGFLLAGVGERLHPGDQVGLLVYSSHVQFSAVLNPGALESPNPFSLLAEGVEIPVFNLAEHPTAQLR